MVELPLMLYILYKAQMSRLSIPEHLDFAWMKLTL